MNKILHYLNPSNKSPNIKTTFNILVYFLFSFLLIRIFIYGMVYGPLPEMYLYIKGVHIHHMNFGIFILAIAGYLSFIVQKESARSKIAKLYGIGLAFTFDEFGMWLFLEDNYWIRQSYDAIIIIAVIFLNIIYFNKIWRKVFDKNLVFWKKVLKKIAKVIQK